MTLTAEAEDVTEPAADTEAEDAPVKEEAPAENDK